MSAVGLGWERAFGKVEKAGDIDQEQKGWVEIDNRWVTLSHALHGV
jgi:hypothetical protein